MDLTFFSSLKAELKKLIWNWQCDKLNAGQSLNKYTVVVHLHQATENCLDKPGVIENGFRRAGLYPWDKSAPDTTKLLPGTIFADSGESNAGQSTSPYGSAPPISQDDYQVITPAVMASTDSQAREVQTTFTDSTFVQDDFLSISMDVMFSPIVQFQTTPASVPEDFQSTSLGEQASFSVGHDYLLTTPTAAAYIKEGFPAISPSDGVSDLDQDDVEAIYPSAGESLLGQDDFQTIQDDLEITPPPPSVSPVKSVHPGKSNTSIKCPKCSRGIPERVFDIHHSTCSVTQEPATTKLLTVPDLSLKERGRQLNKFEILLLSEETAEEFNKLFADRNLDVQEPLYQAWLVLKNASLPTEAQALKKVLEDHTASNIPKKKTNRKRNLPQGPARYDPSSPEWEEILTEQALKKKKPNETKEKQSQAKQKPAQPKQKPSQPKQKPGPANTKEKKDKTSKRKLRL